MCLDNPELHVNDNYLVVCLYKLQVIRFKLSARKLSYRDPHMVLCAIPIFKSFKSSFLLSPIPTSMNELDPICLLLNSFIHSFDKVLIFSPQKIVLITVLLQAVYLTPTHALPIINIGYSKTNQMA